MARRFPWSKAYTMMRPTLASLCLVLAISVPTSDAVAHSVGQVQTTLYLTPDTVEVLTDRAVLGEEVLRVGDELSYVIEFTPIENGATVGAGGYVSAYLPEGVEVIDASFVVPDGSGGFSPVAPALPGPISNGGGRRGRRQFGDADASWAGAYDDACTTGDVCLDGECATTGTLDCDDESVCTTEECDVEDGCVYTNVSVTCTDGDECTENDACDEGSCMGAEKACQIARSHGAY